jgi:hypothetical protein
MQHLQEAFDALEEIKRLRADDPIAAVGFNSDSLLTAVGKVIHDVGATAERMEIPLDEVGQTLFIDGLMMGVLLAARAPVNHAFRAVAVARGEGAS